MLYNGIYLNYDNLIQLAYQLKIKIKEINSCYESIETNIKQIDGSNDNWQGEDQKEFYEIFDFVKGKFDKNVSKLIEIYKTYLGRVSLNSEELKELKQYDYVLGRYLDDYTFRKELKNEIVHIQIKKTCSDILRAIVESVIKIFDNYLENSTRKITIARWI